MGTGIPSDMAPFVERMVSGRRFLSEQDVMAEGLRMLQARETLREEVVKGFEQLDAGLGIHGVWKLRVADLSHAFVSRFQTQVCERVEEVTALAEDRHDFAVLEEEGNPGFHRDHHHRW